MVDILIGLQWGDEGKGKIVDVLTENYDVIARFQGGPNAGHTLEFEDKKFVLHLIPSGIFREHTINVIGNGVVFDPVIFRQEVNEIEPQVPDIRKRLFISTKAHLILPSHRMLDAAYEQAKGKGKIGSTLRGIAPTYTDKISRNGLRIGEILRPGFDKKLAEITAKHKEILDFLKYDYSGLDEQLYKWLEAIEFLRSFEVINTEYFINNEIAKDKKILAEGAQGSLLDIDFGTYPFVTSSNTIAPGANIGLGIGANKINRVFGIFKAYTTRVGNGPFPTELSDSTGEELRSKGGEFGATTGRPRRTGWLDLVALKYAVMISGVTDLIITKADVLCGFDKIKVATAYDIEGMETDQFPYSLDNVKPVYKELEGWSENLSVGSLNSLPANFVNYLDFISGKMGVPITGISVGAKRKEMIWKE